MVAQKKVDLLPFAMLFIDAVSNKERGYTDFDTTDRIYRDRTIRTDLTNEFQSSALQPFLTFCLKYRSKHDLCRSALNCKLDILHAVTGHTDLFKIRCQCITPDI